MSDTEFENKLHDIYLIRVDSVYGTWIHSAADHTIFRTHHDAAIECVRLNAVTMFGQVYTPIRVTPVESDE